MNKEVTGPYSDDLSNEEYHSLKSYTSSSTLKLFIEDPALMRWDRNAPKDQSKMEAIDFGTMFHAYFLEPDHFYAKYKLMPQFNMRTNDGKAQHAKFMESVADTDVQVCTEDDLKKIQAMTLSAKVHPTVGAIMDMDGIAERSYFWTDDETGVKCKCRPDYIVTDVKKPFPWMNGAKHLVMDVKTIAQIDRLQAQIETLKYYVQDAFYTKGLEQILGGDVCFVFVFVSTSISLGRYPVKVVLLDPVAKHEGRLIVDSGLREYAEYMANNDPQLWQTVTIIDRPAWATRDENTL